MVHVHQLKEKFNKLSAYEAEPIFCMNYVLMQTGHDIKGYGLQIKNKDLFESIKNIFENRNFDISE